MVTVTASGTSLKVDLPSDSSFVFLAHLTKNHTQCLTKSDFQSPTQ